MAERAALVRDYSAVDSEEHVERTLTELAALPHQELLDFGRLAELLGYDRKTSTIDFAVSPRGYRALSRIPRLPRLVVQKIVRHFGDLDAIVNAAEKESKDLLGEKRDYLTIKILHNDMTVMVPCENAHRAGLRRVIDGEDVEKVIAVLTGEVSDMPKNWNRRFKHNREKIKTGDVFELAEVVRNLAIREWEKGLSTGEKQMYTRAKKILASEFMYALEKDEAGAEGYLDELLEERFGATAAA